MARSALATSTAIKVLAGSDSFELTRDDLNRHPNSLLHSLMDSVETAAEGVPLELDLSSALSTSKFSTFTHATAITAALYRHERLPVHLLVDAAESHTTTDLLKKLQQLLDFLDLPGPVSKYLPDMGTIPLRHLDLLDIHVEAAAQHAVELMLGSCGLAYGAAFFCARLEEKVTSHYDVVVYSLGGGDLQRLPKNHATSGNTVTDLAFDGVMAVRLPAGKGSASIAARDVLAQHRMNVSATSYGMLCERMSAILKSAVAQVPLRGKKGSVQTSTFKVGAVVQHRYTATTVQAVWW